MGFRVWKLGFGPAVSGVHASAFAAGFKCDLVLGFIGCAKTKEARLVTYIAKSTRTFRARQRREVGLLATGGALRGASRLYNGVFNLQGS